MEKFTLSILIPAKDEAKRLPPFLEQTLDFAQKFDGRVEIIVINDGSEDNTAEVVASYQEKYHDLMLIDLPTNKGKGYALKQGMLASRGEVIVFLDADGSTPITEINRHISKLKNEADIVIGSRVLKDNEAHVAARAHRKWIGMIFNFIVHFLLCLAWHLNRFLPVFSLRGVYIF